MFLEIPVPAKVLGEQVARLLDEAQTSLSVAGACCLNRLWRSILRTTCGASVLVEWPCLRSR